MVLKALLIVGQWWEGNSQELTKHPVWDEHNADLAGHPAFEAAHTACRHAHRQMIIASAGFESGGTLTDQQKKNIEGAGDALQKADAALAKGLATLSQP
jgi:hypothetical protein